MFVVKIYKDDILNLYKNGCYFLFLDGLMMSMLYILFNWLIVLDSVCIKEVFVCL